LQGENGDGVEAVSSADLPLYHGLLTTRVEKLAEYNRQAYCSGAVHTENASRQIKPFGSSILFDSHLATDECQGPTLSYSYAE
jgi:hypothetical protein